MTRIAPGQYLPAALVLALLVLLAQTVRADPNALWRIVHDRCVLDQVQHGQPAPCAQVSLSGGWAVLKDRRGATQFLLIPTTRVTGIEDPALLAPDSPNYFAAAWAARGDMLARVGHALPREDITLAINSPFGRSQDQLHIHIDCIRSDVRDILHRQVGEIGASWANLPGGLLHHPYLVRRLDSADLTDANPFRLLAEAPGVGAGGLGSWTLVVAGATFPDASKSGARPGFILLADRQDAHTGDRAGGEELQDHGCALAQPAAD